MVDEVTHELLRLNQTDCSTASCWADWKTVCRSLCDPTLTCFEPEAMGQLVEGLEFHRFYFQFPGAKPPLNTTMASPHVRLMGDVAIISYVRLNQRVSGDGVPTTRSVEETRVWQKLNGVWKHVHFHRSAPDQVNQSPTFMKRKMGFFRARRGCWRLRWQRQRPAQDTRKSIRAFALVVDDPEVAACLIIGLIRSRSATRRRTRQSCWRARRMCIAIPENGGPTTKRHGRQEHQEMARRQQVGCRSLQLGPARHQARHRQASGSDRCLRDEPARTGQGDQGDEREADLGLDDAGSRGQDQSAAHKNEDVIAYNAIAKKIAWRENGVAINDLYGYALPQLEKIQLKANVHFSDKGSTALAERVAAAIEAGLNK